MVGTEVAEAVTAADVVMVEDILVAVVAKAVRAKEAKVGARTSAEKGRLEAAVATARVVNLKAHEPDARRVEGQAL